MVAVLIIGISVCNFHRLAKIIIPHFWRKQQYFDYLVFMVFKTLIKNVIGRREVSQVRFKFQRARGVTAAKHDVGDRKNRYTRVSEATCTESMKM